MGQEQPFHSPFLVKLTSRCTRRTPESGPSLFHEAACRVNSTDRLTLPLRIHVWGGVAHKLVVAVVDDDESVRESLPDLLQSFGLSAHAYSSAEEFLASDSIGQTKCLVLDIAMPGMTGLALQR